jgi:hypothetical protein
MRIAFAAICLAVTLTGFREYAQDAQSGAKATTTTPRQNSSIQIEVVALTRFGFEPAKISRKAGPFILELENRSRAALNARLGTPAAAGAPAGILLGTVLQSVPLQLMRPDQSNLVDLPPGTYLLIEDKHPQWQCRITITP